LRKELYDLEQRVRILTERLGFDNLDRAEESLDENLIDAVREHKAAAARIETLTAELASVKAQLAVEQAARIEDQQQLESLGVDLARKKQSNLEAQAESELNREALSRLKLELQSEWQKTSKLESMLSSLRKENEAISSECEALKAVAAKDRAQRSSLAPETPLRAPMVVDSRRADRWAIKPAIFLSLYSWLEDIALERIRHLNVLSSTIPLFPWRLSSLIFEANTMNFSPQRQGCLKSTPEI
jgi:predicted RNase H-like nuclease (RuvC/YqgF family)